MKEKAEVYPMKSVFTKHNRLHRSYSRINKKWERGGIRCVCRLVYLNRFIKAQATWEDYIAKVA